MSGIDTKLRTINDFSDAARAIPQLEQNVSDALTRVAAQALPLLTPTNKKTSAYGAAVGELVVAAGTFPVTLPIAAAQNAGRRIGIELQSGAVTVSAASGQVQGGASDAISTVGRYEYESDGVGWWRPPVGGGGGGAVTSVTAGDASLTIAPNVGAVVAALSASYRAALQLTDFTQNIGKGTSGTFDITGLSGLTVGKNVRIVQTAQPIASKGNARDEFEMDNIELTGYVLSATTIRAYWHASGIVVGTYAFGYSVAA